ncbi:MAG TPA: LamG-like jellyroll fold domain-containing protein [Solirubrobacterales bacterium]
MKSLLLLTLTLVASLLLSAGSAEASVVTRLAGVESPTSSPYDFDQVKVNEECAGSSAERDTSKSFAGQASLKVHVEATKCSPFARGIFNSNAPNHIMEGDDLWFGAAIFLPSGFFSAHTDYTDLIRIDSYVTDGGELNESAKQQSINLASFKNDDIYVQAESSEKTNTLVGPLSPSVLSENAWHWVEIHAVLDKDSGEALTELKIDGESMGSSTTANFFAGRADFNRLRYGLVSAGGSGSGNLTMYVDRASIGKTERGPLTSTTPGLVSYWRLGEPSGTTAADAQGVASGTYANSPELGVASLLKGETDTAVNFDGKDDHVSISPVAALNMTSEVTLEAWIKADALQGAVLRRNNSYELRAQSDGSVLFRVWVGEEVRSLTSAEGKVKTGTTYHVAGTYDGSTMRIYVNGQEIASKAQAGSMTHNSNTLYIGRNDFSNTYFDGVIDDVAIYDQALSEAALDQHYESGAP